MVEGGKDLSVRQRRFVAELAKGRTKKGAAEAAGYSHPEVQGSALLRRPQIREALEGEFEAQGLTTQYLAARIKDLCEACDEREDGRTAPNWNVRVKGAGLLMRLLGVDKQADAVKLAFEETVSRMLEEARAYDPGIRIIDAGDTGGGNRTENRRFEQAAVVVARAGVEKPQCGSGEWNSWSEKLRNGDRGSRKRG